jgi:iron-sulfur cluster assembly accessory protein
MWHAGIVLYANGVGLWKDGLGGVAQQERGGVAASQEFGIISLWISSRRFWARAEAKRIMISLTPVASSKVKEIMQMQSPVPTALRVAVVGGGCSGFQYHMAFENQTNESDEVLDFDGLKVAVDQMSSMYLDGVEIDYIETLEGAGFKFNNPNVKSTCGCGSSFTV